VSYPGAEITRITEELSSYLDLSIASSADRAVASQATLTSDICIAPGSEPRNLKKTTQAVDRICWTPTGRLVYTSTASGNRDLWIMKPDGTEQRQLTNDPAVDGAPAVTRDNRFIVFRSNRTGSFQIWRMDIDGSNQIQLTGGAAKDHPAISPDGKSVLFNTTDNWHLWKVSIDGGEPVRLTDYVASRPSVSHDGKIACIGRTESKSELLVLSLEGRQPLKRFDFAGWSSRLQWTADGKALIYRIEHNGGTALFKRTIAGGPPEEIMSLDEDELFSFGFSHDERFLAIIRGGWQHDLVLINDLTRNY
jgi:Tol biopolymer transport system component